MILLLLILLVIPHRVWAIDIQYLLTTGQVTAIESGSIQPVQGHGVITVAAVPSIAPCLPPDAANAKVLIVNLTTLLPEVKTEAGCLSGTWHPKGNPETYAVYVMNGRETEDAGRDLLEVVRERLMSRRACQVLTREVQISCPGTDTTQACTDYRTDVSAICASVEDLKTDEGY